MPHSVSGMTEIGTRQSAHILVKRIPGAIETEDEGAIPGAIRDPDAWMLVRRGASEARIQFWVEGASSNGDGGRTEQWDGGHFGDGGGERWEETWNACKAYKPVWRE